MKTNRLVDWREESSEKSERWHRTVEVGVCEGLEVKRYTATPYLAGHETGQTQVGYMIEDCPKVFLTEVEMFQRVKRVVSA